MSNIKPEVIGVQEKRELAKLIDAEFETIIKAVQQDLDMAEGVVKGDMYKKFGLKVVDQEIKNLEQKIALLKQQKDKLGFDDGYHCKAGLKTVFDHDSNTYIVDKRTQAGAYYYAKVNRMHDIQALKSQKEKRLKSLWLETARDIVVKLVNTKPDIKFIEFKPQAIKKLR